MRKGRRGTGGPGAFLALGLILLTLAPLAAAFAVHGSGGTERGPAGFLRRIPELWAAPGTVTALRFTLSQAAASTVAALIAGFPGAWMAGRYRFRGRRFLMALSAVPFCLPPILVVLSFVSYYGRSGSIAKLAALAGLEPPAAGGFLYGFWGIVVVHAFYNFPIVVQTVGSVWSRIPSSKEEAARTLGAGRLRAFITGTLPALLPSMVQAASLVFLFCFFSFTVVLVFGSLAGSTIEVEIYRAARFVGDYDTALALALLQSVVALAVTALFGAMDGRARAVERDLGSVREGRRPGAAARAAIGAYFVLVGLFFLGPLASLAVQAFGARGLRLFGVAAGGTTGVSPGGVAGAYAEPLMRALGGSLATALPAAAAATAVALLASLAARRSRGGRLMELAFTLPLASSAALTAIGWGILFPDGAVAAIAAGQTAMVWPYTARAISGAFSALDGRRRAAARTLGASPLRAFLDTDFAVVLPSVLSAGAFAFSMAAGDTTIPLVLGRGEVETLPILIYRLASSYRFEEAAAAGVVLALLTGAAFFLKERSGR